MLLALPGQIGQIAELAQVAHQQRTPDILSEYLQPVHDVDALGAPVS